MKKLMKIIPLALVFLPAVALAQLTQTEGLIRRAGSIVDYLTTLMAGIALLVFFWGLVKFIFAQGSETSKLEAKKIMGWGLVALFVMVSIWGLIYFIGDELFPGVTNYSAPEIPAFRQP